MSGFLSFIDHRVKTRKYNISEIASVSIPRWWRADIYECELYVRGRGQVIGYVCNWTELILICCGCYV
jgi:hypothetical protein